MEVEPYGEVSKKSIQQAEDTERVRTEVRPIAKQFINKITMYANNRYVDGFRMSAAIGCAIMERLVISVAGRLHKDDREAGEALINTVYQASCKDAIAQWRQM